MSSMSSSCSVGETTEAGTGWLDRDAIKGFELGNDVAGMLAAGEG